MSLRKWILIAVLLGTLVGCNGNWSSGDRVLVSKCSYDNPITGPSRFDVVVFKYPRAPVDNNTPKNYIKRLLGLPGELLAIFFGRIYRWTPPENAAPPFDDVKKGVAANDLWHKEHMHVDHPTSNKWFEGGEFEIVRKSPQTMLALRRIVHDNDFQAKDLKGKLDRWNPNAKSNWKSDGQTGFVFEGKDDSIDWLHYRHLLRPKGGIGGELKVDPELISDSLAYNNIKVLHGKDVVDKAQMHHRHWVGDLMLECNVEVVEAKGEFYFELSKGIYRYQARWDLATGKCALLRVKDGKVEEKPLAVVDTAVKAPGNYMLRFANIDARLTVWVDRALPFDQGHDYDPPEVRKKNEKISDAERRGPTKNDLEPASIGSKAAHVKVAHVRLWRDTYYITTTNPGHDYSATPESWSDPAAWKTIREARFTTLYVQPGHYLCLGDNSQASSDSREWGTVPDRLMLGRALVVYYPLDRIGLIR